MTTLQIYIYNTTRFLERQTNLNNTCFFKMMIQVLQHNKQNVQYEKKRKKLKLIH